MDQQQTVTISLIGADLELLRAGEAQGYARGTREATKTIREAIQAWEAQAREQATDDEQQQQVDAFVRSVYSMLESIDQKAAAQEVEQHQIMGKAIALGAGQPRERKLRQRVRSAIVGLRDGWRK